MADPDTNANDVRDANDAFYKALSGWLARGHSAAYAHDTDVTALHEDSKEVAVGWQAVLASWEAVPFDAFSELSVTMSDPVIKISGSSARVVGFEKVHGKMKSRAGIRVDGFLERISLRSERAGGCWCITTPAKRLKNSWTEGILLSHT